MSWRNHLCSRANWQTPDVSVSMLLQAVDESAWRGGIRLAVCTLYQHTIHTISTHYIHYINRFGRGAVASVLRHVVCFCACVKYVRLFVSLPILSPSFSLYLSLPLPLTFTLILPLTLTLTLPVLSLGERARVCYFVYPLSLILTRSSTL